MKFRWVVLIALIAFGAGLFGGGLMGTAGGAAGGGLAGICYTTQVAVREGLLTEDARQKLFRVLSANEGKTADAPQFAGDLDAACKNLAKAPN